MTLEHDAGNSYIFLSYASANRQRALEISQVLQSSGVKVWIDRRDIVPGRQWSAEIAKGLRHAEAVLLLQSVESMASNNVRQEMNLSWEYGRPVVPLRLDSA